MLIAPTLPDATIVRLAEADFGRLSRLCLSCSGFYELVEGRPASDATAAEILGPLAPQYAACAKHVFAVEKGGDLIAVTELLQGHPSARDWYIGLLLVDPEHRGRGLGARLCAAILDWIGGHDGVMVRLVVQQQNREAREFWERRGFHMEREVMKQSGRLENLVWILARSPKGAG
jgi:GNAT superfamily N-acetyltransferase